MEPGDLYMLDPRATHCPLCADSDVATELVVGRMPKGGSQKFCPYHGQVTGVEITYQPRKMWVPHG